MEKYIAYFGKKLYSINPSEQKTISSDLVLSCKPVEYVYVFTSDRNCEIKKIRSEYKNVCDMPHDIGKGSGVVKIDIEHDKRYECLYHTGNYIFKIDAEVLNNNTEPVCINLVLLVKFME